MVATDEELHIRPEATIIADDKFRGQRREPYDMEIAIGMVTYGHVRARNEVCGTDIVMPVALSEPVIIHKKPKEADNLIHI
jgi:hypothetical protein